LAFTLSTVQYDQYKIPLVTILISIFLFPISHANIKPMENDKNLTPQEKNVILNKATEAPFSGEYYKNMEKGTYFCKRCGTALYNSTDKSDSGCGWPSFDDAILGAVKSVPDADGKRTEIICNNCGAHLGHVFIGEHLTNKNTRYCVNSISMIFKPANDSKETAYFAAGCFWGVEYYLQKAPGVLSTTVGYMGGRKKDPSYEEVSYHKTGHAETVQVFFDNKKTSFEDIAKLFFEIHDPAQADGQGPDIGDQYRSEIFYTNEKQKLISQELIKTLKKMGLNVVTQLVKAPQFYPAEDYHQDYYAKNGQSPYCHIRVKRF